MKKESIAEIKKRIETLDIESYPDVIAYLIEDERIGVKKIALSMENSLKKYRKAQKKTDELIMYERGLINCKVLFSGVDEAGRGPLAGPVVAACVIMKETSKIAGVDDSKKLSETKREKLYDKILQDAVSYGIGISDNIEIDKINILNATFEAMKRAVKEMPIKPEFILVDGNMKIPEEPIMQKNVIDGDALCYSIACASIIAKVTRDKMLAELDKKYPEYDFASNKGYGTDKHYDALRKYGLTPVHRKSFIHL